MHEDSGKAWLVEAIKSTALPMRGQQAAWRFLPLIRRNG
jgi:hypothetical protein